MERMKCQWPFPPFVSFWYTVLIVLLLLSKIIVYSHLQPCLQPYFGVKKYGSFWVLWDQGILCALRAATRRFEKHLGDVLERYIFIRAESRVNPNTCLFFLVNSIQWQILNLSGAEQ